METCNRLMRRGFLQKSKTKKDAAKNRDKVVYENRYIHKSKYLNFISFIV